MEESDYLRKGKEMAEGVSRTVERAAESVSKQSETITQSNIFQSVSQVRQFSLLATVVVNSSFLTDKISFSGIVPTNSVSLHTARKIYIYLPTYLRLGLG